MKNHLLFAVHVIPMRMIINIFVFSIRNSALFDSYMKDPKTNYCKSLLIKNNFTVKVFN